jgi:cytochrome c5
LYQDLGFAIIDSCSQVHTGITVSKADDTFTKQVGVVLGALILFAIVVYFIASSIGDSEFRKLMSMPSATEERISPVGSVRVEGDKVEEAPKVMAKAGTATPAPAPAPTAAASGGGKSGKEVYSSGCIACHATGVGGAPKLGDVPNWTTRAEAGMAGMLKSVMDGKGVMPPKGGTTSSAEELKAAIQYMLDETGVPLEGAKAEEAPKVAAKAETATPAPAATASGGGKSGKEVYSTGCVACHATGVAGAPKLGDLPNWTTRAEAGMAGLLKSVMDGKGVMPPKGGTTSSAEELKAAIQYMLDETGVKL